MVPWWCRSESWSAPPLTVTIILYSFFFEPRKLMVASSILAEAYFWPLSSVVVLLFYALEVNWPGPLKKAAAKKFANESVASRRVSVLNYLFIFSSFSSYPVGYLSDSESLPNPLNQT